MSTDRALTVTSTMMMGIVFTAWMLQNILQPARVIPVSIDQRYGQWYFGPAGYIMNVENGPDEMPMYMGEALPGTRDDEAGWRIYRYEMVTDPVSGDMISGTIRYANGNTNFDKVWDDRTTYEYS